MSLASDCYSSSAFDNAGGLIGFRGELGLVSVDDVTIKTDRDSDGTYETTEHIESFTLDSNGQMPEELDHDQNGNLTYDGVFQYTYDGWNRLVDVTKAYRITSDNGVGGVTLGSIQTGSSITGHEYDGTGRRIEQRVKNSADLDGHYDYYHDGNQVVQEHNGTGYLLRQYVWSQEYVDSLAQVALNDDPADTTEAVCETTLYALHNANYNVLGLVDAAGVVVERYAYDPYGQRQAYISSGSNDVLGLAAVSLSPRWESTPGTVLPFGLNPFGHQGLMHEQVTGLVYNRARMLHPVLGRFVQRDPLGYVDGMNSYAPYHVMHFGLDPSGLWVIEGQACDSNKDTGCYMYLDTGESSEVQTGLLELITAKGGKLPFGMMSYEEFLGRLRKEYVKTLTKETLKLVQDAFGIVNPVARYEKLLKLGFGAGAELFITDVHLKQSAKNSYYILECKCAYWGLGKATWTRTDSGTFEVASDVTVPVPQHAILFGQDLPLFREAVEEALSQSDAELARQFYAKWNAIARRKCPGNNKNILP